MKKGAKKLSDYLLGNGLIDNDDYSIYEYGFQILLEMVLSVLTIVVLSFYFNMILECVLFFIVFIPLRSYAGGYHCNRFISCYILTCITIAGILLLVKFTSISLADSVLIFMVSSLAILKLKMSSHMNGTVDKKAEVYFNKKLKGTLFRITVLEIIFLIMQNQSAVFLVSITMCFVVIVMMAGNIKHNQVLLRGI